MNKKIGVIITDKYCSQYAIGHVSESEEIIFPKLPEDFNMQDFHTFFPAYFINEMGYLEKDESRAEELSKQIKIQDLREKREHDCFPIINRGKLWYDKLSQSQMDELEQWYQAWLDVTKTLIVPEPPAWINEQ